VAAAINGDGESACRIKEYRPEEYDPCGPFHGHSASDRNH
jgi:hypothetical protein